MFVKLLVVGLYVLMIIVIGIIGLKKTQSFKDYFLGGGNIGPWMTAFTYGTAYFSAVLFIGFAGKIGWGFGLSSLWVGLFNAFIGVLGVWWLLGWKIKQMATKYDVHTLPEYLEIRYNSPAIKLFGSLAVFVFFIPYSAAVFMGLSYLFQATFEISYVYALLFMGFFTAVYLVLGGYKSMTMVDVGFGIIMTIGVLILLFFNIRVGGGLPKIMNDLAAIDPKLIAPVGPGGAWPLFCLVFLTSVAPFGMPQLVQKFYAIRDKKAVHIGMVASTVFAILIGCIAYFSGATARLFLNAQNAPAAFSPDGKPIFDALMPELLTKIIPESLSVVMLLLILSASMSTLAALVLISSSSVAKDIYAGFIDRNVSDKKLTRLMRFFSAFFVLLSVILALYKPSTIVTILGISWGAIGSVFLGPFIWGLFWPRVNKVAAWASSVLGLGACLVLYLTGTSSPEAGTIGMIISLVLPPVIAIFSPKVEEKKA